MRPSPTPSTALIPALLIAGLGLGGGMVARAEIGQDDQPVAPPSMVLAQATPTTAELAQLKQEADLAFSRATTLFFVLLGSLVALLGVGVGMLWLMRRSVIQEVSVVVRNQINDITNLERKIHAATRDLEQILSQAEEMASAIESRTDRFQEEALTKKQVLNRLVDDLAEFKARTLNDWQSTLADLQVKLEVTEADFVGHLSSLRQSADDQVVSLRKDTQLQRDAVFRTLEEAQTYFLRDVNRLRSDVEIHQDGVLQKLNQGQASFSDRLTSLTTTVQEERDRAIVALADLRQQLIGQAGEQVEKQAAAITADLDRQRQVSLERLQTQEQEVSRQLHDLQVGIYGHRDLAMDTIQRNLEEFSQRFANLRTEVESQRNRVLQDLRQSADDFLGQFGSLKVDLEQGQARLMAHLQSTADQALDQFPCSKPRRSRASAAPWRTLTRLTRIYRPSWVKWQPRQRFSDRRYSRIWRPLPRPLKTRPRRCRVRPWSAIARCWITWRRWRRPWRSSWGRCGS